MRSRRRRLVAALALVGALAVTSALTACGGDSGGDAGVASNKVTNTTLPKLYTVRRSGTLIAVVYNGGNPPGMPAQGQLIYSQGQIPTEADAWDEAGNAPPPGWCETYGPQLVEPYTANWSQPDPVQPGEDWKQYVGNMSNQQPCPELPPR